MDKPSVFVPLVMFDAEAWGWSAFVEERDPDTLDVVWADWVGDFGSRSFAIEECAQRWKQLVYKSLSRSIS